MHLNTLKKTGLQCQKIKIEEKVQVHVSTVTNPYLTINIYASFVQDFLTNLS